MASDDERQKAKGLDVHFRTVQHSLNTLGSQVDSISSAVDRLQRLHALYTARHVDPEALPKFMVECRLIEKDLGSVLVELNRYLFSRRGQNTSGDTVEATSWRLEPRPAQGRSRPLRQAQPLAGDDEPDWVANFDPDDFEEPRR